MWEGHMEVRDIFDLQTVAPHRRSGRLPGDTDSADSTLLADDLRRVIRGDDKWGDAKPSGH